MNIDELKQAWQQSDGTRWQQNCESLQREITRSRSKLTTARDRLGRRYLILVALCLLFLILVTSGAIEMHVEIFVLINLCALMGMFAVFNFVLYIQVHDLDPTRLSSVDMIRHIAYFRTLRRRFRIIGMAVGFPAVAFLLIDLMASSFVPAIIGALIGGTIGAIVGIYKEHSIRRLMSDIERDLGDLEEEDCDGEPS